jgi:uncharacterized protein YxeA
MVSFFKKYDKEIVNTILGLLATVIGGVLVWFFTRTDSPPSNIVHRTRINKGVEQTISNADNADNVGRDKITNNYYSKNDSPKKVTKVASTVYPKHNSYKLSKKDTITTKAKYSITAPVINSAVGDNAVNNNNYYGTPQRHLTEEDKRLLISSIPNKDSAIEFYYLQGKECENYVNEIGNYLYQTGYKNFVPSTQVLMTTYRIERFEVITNEKGVKIIQVLKPD